MDASLLRNIHDVGEELCRALESTNLARFLELLEKRGTLLERMYQCEHPSDLDSNWRNISSELQEQYQRLSTALEAEKIRIQEALTEVERFKGASLSYQRTTPKGQILNKNLRI